MAPKNFEDARRHIEALFNHQFKNPVFLHEALNGADATFTADHLVTEPTIKLALLGETAVELITLSGECKDPTKSSQDVCFRRANCSLSQFGLWARQRGLAECVANKVEVTNVVLVVVVKAILGAIVLDSDYETPKLTIALINIMTDMPPVTT